MEKICLLQNSLQRFEKHKFYRERLLKVNVTDQPQNSESSETSKAPKQEEDLFKFLSIVVDLMPQSYMSKVKDS